MIAKYLVGNPCSTFRASYRILGLNSCSCCYWIATYACIESLLLACYSRIWPYDLMTSWLAVTWPVFFSGARVQVRWEHARERGARQGAAHLLGPVPVRGIPSRKRANHAPHPRHTDPHPSFHEPGWIWGGCQAGIQPLVANLHCKTSILKRHSSKSVTSRAWCECEHAYTLISSVWQLWCGSVVSLWWPLVCYLGISHIPECIAGFLLRLITPEELTKYIQYFFLEQSPYTYSVHTSRVQNYSNTDSFLIFETNYMSSSKWRLNVATHTQLSSVSMDQTRTSKGNYTSASDRIYLTCSNSLTQHTQAQ